MCLLDVRGMHVSIYQCDLCFVLFIEAFASLWLRVFLHRNSGRILSGGRKAGGRRGVGKQGAEQRISCLCGWLKYVCGVVHLGIYWLPRKKIGYLRIVDRTQLHDEE